MSRIIGDIRCLAVHARFRYIAPTSLLVRRPVICTLLFSAHVLFFFHSVDKTGLDFAVRSKPFIGSAKSVAGQNLCGSK